MDYFGLLSRLLDALIECFQNRSRAEIKYSLQHPRLLEILILRGILRRDYGLNGQQLRREVDATVDAAAHMSESLLAQLLDEAQAEALELQRVSVSQNDE